MWLSENEGAKFWLNVLTELQNRGVSVGLQELDLLLAEWQHYYNWERPHSSLNGLTPIDRITEISDQTPLSEEVSQNYQIKKERFQEQNYKLDLQLRKLKPSL
ncbi:transposase [Vibrio cholerae]|nr:transposase [Vibrio cholerae]